MNAALSALSRGGRVMICSRHKIWLTHSTKAGRTRKGLRWLFILLGIVWMMAINANGNAVFASPSIQISSVVGYNGFYAKDQWIPVNLTIDNGGPTVDAELQLYANFPVGNGGRFAEGLLRWPVHLRAHSRTVKQIAVPGPLIEEETAVVCNVHGQPVASAKLSGTALGNVSLVAVLTRGAQLERVFTGLTDGAGGEPVLPVSWSPESFPQSANLLTGIRAIAADPDTLALALTSEQRQALLTWVKLGGMLIVTGTGSVAGWSGYLPLQPGPVKTVKGEKLAQFLGRSVTPPKSFRSSAGELAQSASVWAGTDQEPYVAAMSVGRGTVIQTSFDPTQPSLLAWPSNAAFWTKLLEMGGPHGKSALPNLLSPDSTLALLSASDALTPLQIPSLSFWASVFLIYALLLGPVVFLVLRKLRAEALAWFILPALSIVVTIGIYSFGANQRPSGVLTEGVGVLDLVGDGVAEAYGIRGFMSPLITSGFASADQPLLMFPLAQHNVRELGTASAVYGGTTTVTFEDVGRWGIRYIYAAGAVQRQGQLATDLWADFDTLAGTITNQTPYTLHNVAVCWNHSLYLVGDLKPGAMATINRDTKTQDALTSYLTAYSSYNKEILYGVGRPLGTLAAREHLFSFDESNDRNGQAMIVATTDNEIPALPDLETGQAVAQQNTVVLVRQFAPVTVFPPEEVTPE